MVAAALAATVVGVLGAAPPVGAGEVEVTGSFTASGSFTSEPACPMFHTWHWGGGEWTGLGTSTFELDYCVDLRFLPEETSPLVGTFTIEAEGGSLTGDVVGAVSNVGEPEGFPADYELTITAGTGAYDRASGALTFDAVWNGSLAPVFAMEGTVSGTVVVPPPLPTGVDDCRHGGWRDLGDETGQPFRNQGSCIRWVHEHL